MPKNYKGFTSVMLIRCSGLWNAAKSLSLMSSPAISSWNDMNTTNKIFIGWTFSAQNPHPTRHSSHCSKTLEPDIKKGYVILILWWFTRRSGIHKLFVHFIWIYNFSTFVLQSSNRRLRIWAWIETHFPQSPCDRESRAAKPTSGMVTILAF